MLLAVSGLNNYMVVKGKASQFSIVVDTAEAIEVHHLQPWLVMVRLRFTLMALMRH